MSGPFNIDERLNKSDKATQATAEAGTDDTQWMSPLKTLQSIQANAVSSSPIIENSVTYTVGSTGDYPTLNAAIEDVSRKYPIYKQAGVCVTLEMQAGFVMAEQVLVDGIDLSWITITGVDTETVIDRQAITQNFPARLTGGAALLPAFAADNSGRLPTVDQLFSFNTTGTASLYRAGIALVSASAVFVLPGKGVKNSDGFGIKAVGACQAAIKESIFTNCRIGVISQLQSTIHAYGVDTSGASTKGFVVEFGGFLSAHAGTGTAAQAVNTLTSSGIIFQ